MNDGCKKCDTNFALKYTVTNNRGEIDYSACLNSAVSNCLAISTSGDCGVCYEGYKLVDNECLLIDIPNASTTRNFNSSLGKLMLGYDMAVNKSP
ncbi:MAG: hypothetical protein DHS20C09_15580 [marine bacterium B5-7]|nr:MAG: hypothetical protein DHS20C09_15580 [marine bacterium B5-7]